MLNLAEIYNKLYHRMKLPLTLACCSFNYYFLNLVMYEPANN